MNTESNERAAPGPIYVLVNQHGRLMEDLCFSDSAEADRMAEAYTDFDDRFQAVQVAPVDALAPASDKPAQPVEAVDVTEAMVQDACAAYWHGRTVATSGTQDDSSAMRAALTAALAHPRPTVEQAKPSVTFKRLIGFSAFSDGSRYAELADITGHPRLGDGPYARTSPIEVVFYKGATVVRIVTENTVYDLADVPEVSHD